MKINIKHVTILICLIVAAFIIERSFPDKNTYLNMTSVCDFKVTETGLMLYTEDGDGYYWER